MSGLPARVKIALGVTILAVVVLGAMTVLGGSGSDGGTSGDRTSAEIGDGRGGGNSETTTTIATTTTTNLTTTTSIEVPSYWYPKGSSRYSDRKPPVTVTTIGDDEKTVGDTTRTGTEGSSDDSSTSGN